MESEKAVQKLSALAQDARLAVFRLLVKAGPDGMAAGDIARFDLWLGRFPALHTC